MTNKEIEEKRESISQQVRNWNGSDIAFDGIIGNLVLLKKAMDEANKNYSTIEGAILQSYGTEKNK